MSRCHGSRRRRRHAWRSPRVSISDRRLYRDPDRGRLAGVCAGLADYFQVSTTMTRFGLITALIFVPQVTIFAYLLAWWLLPKRSELEFDTEPEPVEDFEADIARERAKQRDFDRKLAEEELDLDERRFAVRRARERLGTIERRIRSLEAYVTSRRYDLDREFGKL